MWWKNPVNSPGANRHFPSALSDPGRLVSSAVAEDASGRSSSDRTAGWTLVCRCFTEFWLTLGLERFDCGHFVNPQTSRLHWTLWYVGLDVINALRTVSSAAQLSAELEGFTLVWLDGLTLYIFIGGRVARSFTSTDQLMAECFGGLWLAACGLWGFELLAWVWSDETLQFGLNCWFHISAVT